MRLTVNDLEEIRIKQRPTIRFSVSVVADDGEPLWTCEGWLMGQDREIHAPGVMTRWGIKRFHKTAPRFIAMLKAAIEANFPGIEEVLGIPAIDEMPEARRLEGIGEVR